MNIYCQSHNLAAAPTERNSNVVGIKDVTINGKEITSFSSANRIFNCCLTRPISDGMEKVL